ncbi:MAG: sulfurtransferase, partial [Hyphomonadaceae bacterium]|nr:sulfurtransferase [Hyphomonadaceae bacterium]
MTSPDENTVIVDATWVVPGSNPDFRYGILDGAREFDLASLKLNTPLGHRFPPPQIIAHMLEKSGISSGDYIKIYDRVGLFSSPFVRWAIRSIGVKNVSILNPVPSHMKIVDAHTVPKTRGSMTIKEPLVKAVVKEEVLAAIGSDTQIVDARGHGRFAGVEPEPRAGLRSGHIPGSINMPYGDMLDDNR